MKKTIVSVCAAAALLAFGPSASALVYNNADLLLIFHQDGYDDCEFDLGPVSNYLSMTPGTKVALSNWSANLVLANYGSFTAANFILMAAAPLQGPSNLGADADWLSCSDGSIPKDLTGSTFAGQNSIINGVGSFAAANSSNAATNGYAVPTSIAGSYTWVITEGGVLDEQTLGGAAAFSVQQSIPGTSTFFQIGANNSVNPPAAVQVGSFTIDADGVLTFIAGAVPGAAPVAHGVRYDRGRRQHHFICHQRLRQVPAALFKRPLHPGGKLAGHRRFDHRQRIEPDAAGYHLRDEVLRGGGLLLRQTDPKDQRTKRFK